MSQVSEGSGANSGLIQTLETDYRQLAFDSRKSEGFAGIFGSSSSHPEVKEAAERVLVLLRNVKQVQYPSKELQGSKVGNSRCVINIINGLVNDGIYLPWLYWNYSSMNTLVFGVNKWFGMSVRGWIRGLNVPCLYAGCTAQAPGACL